MDTGYIASWVTIIGMVLTFAGITNVDPAVLTSVVTGVIGAVTLIGAIYAHYKRPSVTA